MKKQMVNGFWNGTGSYWILVNHSNNNSRKMRRLGFSYDAKNGWSKNLGTIDKAKTFCAKELGLKLLDTTV